jgi:murein L,D-transpeptidase YafK
MKLLIISLIIITNTLFAQIPSSVRVKKAREKYEPILKKEFKDKGLVFGSNIFLRIIKDEDLLEIWVKKGEKYSLFKTYKICTYSGGLGPKHRQGDGKSPEGFYFVKPIQLNPWSSYHLAFNTGYPNSYDRAHGYTGSLLMVHGDCCSIGCYAMTDDRIDEIYTIIYNAFKKGQPFFRIHIFPFRMTNDKMAKFKLSNDNLYKEYGKFWENIKLGYDLFEKNKIPPNVNVQNKKYVFD